MGDTAPLRRSPDSSMRRNGALPNFLMAGTMRSGTSSLTRYLDAHPEVFVSRPKEIHYFDINFDEGLDWYRAHFSRVSGERAIGDCTPSYVYLEDAVARMAQALPEARVIVILRNPVDRAYSHYWLRRSMGAETLNFMEAIAAEPERLAAGDPRKACPYLDMSRYLYQLERLCRYYAREAVHVMILEELRDSPLAAYRSVCRFLEVDDAFAPANLGQIVNPFVTFRSLRVRKLRRRLPRPMRRLVGRLNTRKSSYPPLDPSLRTELSDQFASDNAALATWLGRDLSVWEA